MNILSYIFNTIFKKKDITQEVQLKKAGNPDKILPPQTTGFSAFIELKNHKFKIFLN